MDLEWRERVLKIDQIDDVRTSWFNYWFADMWWASTFKPPEPNSECFLRPFPLILVTFIYPKSNVQFKVDDIMSYTTIHIPFLDSQAPTRHTFNNSLNNTLNHKTAMLYLKGQTTRTELGHWGVVSESLLHSISGDNAYRRLMHFDRLTGSSHSTHSPLFCQAI